MAELAACQYPRRFSAGVIPARWVDDGWRVLVLRAYRQWDFPKGGVEAGETALEAARREALEEASLDDLKFRWGDAFVDTEPYAGGKVARYFLAESPGAEVTLPVSPELGRPEHHEYRWVSLEAAAELLPQRLQPVLRWARERLGV
jgi:8-oxo-dGTP pyrophosphatase MutT (NUDIX family)